ncbi:MAG TPA: FG-GAP-like repeat-containing protein [Puia sp.]|nr:FG-GAP-like repeat-containing protein [Puia sp.]
MLNKGAFKFEDVTRQAHIAGNGTWSTGVSIADVNGDGLLDIYICHGGKYDDSTELSNQLFICQGIRNGVPVYKDMAREYGLDAPGTQSTQAVFFDYDKDGDLDMFLLNHSNHTYNPYLNTRQTRATPDMHFGNRLFRQDRDQQGHIHFTDVTLKAGIINNPLNFGLGVVVSDVNGDGWPDIYTTSDYTERDCFYINNHDGTFTESLERSFTHISKYSMGLDIADYNNDGRPDVMTLDMLPEDNHRQKLLKGPDEYDEYHLLLDSGYYHQQMRNMLHLNEGLDGEGHLRFSEIGQLAGVSNTDWSWSPLFADFDNDGRKDLFVSNGYLRDYTDLDFLKYTVPDAQLAAARDGRTNFKTYDLVKKMPSNKVSSYIFRNNGDLTFTNSTKGWGIYHPAVSNAAAYADLDNDGDLDLIVCTNNEPVIVYRNNESELKKNHFIRLRLRGRGLNTMAFGAKATLTTSDGARQYGELYPVRGFQSSMPPELFFGWPSALIASRITITWPDDSVTVIERPEADGTLDVRENETARSTPAEPAKSGAPGSARRLFTDVSATAGLSFRHRENDFIDFKDEPLLPYQLSREGPALAKADVNGDGLEDIFLGGAIGQGGQLYLQTGDGHFVPASSQPWVADSVAEQVNALFFDADGDGDMDLYVVSGGNEYSEGPGYQDHLYINDGKGNFSPAPPGALPVMTSSKFAIAAGDFDHDGRMDLFIGGRGVPGSFPLPSRSWLLHNDSKDGAVRLTDVTDAAAPALRLPGMVKAAVWTTVDDAAYPDLLIAGDWMPVLLFRNDQGRLSDVSESAGLSHLHGMWSSITPADIDGDGRMDFILGNCGLNNPFKVSPAQPMKLYVSDFDGNGSLDPILCYYIQGKSYPMASRDELLDQIVSLRKKFNSYKAYADATIGDIFPPEKLAQATVLQCDQLASGILYNQGNGRFSFSPFPIAAQSSKVFGAVVDDFDGDGKKDVLVSGNFLPYRTQLGRCDAGLGVLMKGPDLHPVDNAETGCYIGGDVRGMVEVTDRAGEKLIVVAKNNDSVQVLRVTQKMHHSAAAGNAANLLHRAHLQLPPDVPGDDAEPLRRAQAALTDIMVHDIFSPPVASRIYLYSNIAAYETLVHAHSGIYASLHGQVKSFPAIPAPGRTIDYRIAAVYAYLLVGRRMIFSDSAMQDSIRAIIGSFEKPARPVYDASLAYGQKVAGLVIGWSDKDQYTETRRLPRYRILRQPGKWLPTPPAYMAAIEPYWNRIRPVTLDSAGQFKPASAPPFSKDTGSLFYHQAYDVFRTVNSLTDEQKAIANFWDCNPFAVTMEGHLGYSTKKISPGGHWVLIVSTVSRQRHLDMMETASAYTITSIAIFDAIISCWDEKYRSNVIRPETYIDAFISEGWRPVLQTPPFPEYTSGHSIISTVAAIVLTKYFGEHCAFTDDTELEFGLPERHFDSFLQASNEAAISRLYGGIHYRAAIEAGKVSGRHIGEWVLEKIHLKRSYAAR